MKSQYHLDAAESVFFARELEHIYARTYDILYPELKAAMLIPMISEAGSGAENVTYRQWDRVGRAKIMKPGATDAPRVDVHTNEFTRPVRVPMASYGYTLLEIRKSARHNKALDARKAAAARRAVAEVIDYVAAFGSPEDGIADGFLNSAAVTADTITATAWDNPATTSEDIIADVQKVWTNMSTDTKGVEKPNTLLVPDAQYAIIATKPRSTVSDTTVLAFLLANFPGLTAIEPWYRLVGIGGGSTDRAVLYNRSEEKVSQEVPNPFEQLPVFQRGMNFEVECFGETAGTQLAYPRSVRYLDGV